MTPISSEFTDKKVMPCKAIHVVVECTRLSSGIRFRCALLTFSFFDS